MRPTLLASLCVPVHRALESYGIDAASLFRQCGLDPDKLKDPNARYHDPKVLQLWTLAARETSDPTFGLRVADHWHPSYLHALGYAWLASPSLHAAFDRVSRYYRLVVEGESAVLGRDGDNYEFTISTLSGEQLGTDESNDSGVAILVDMCRTIKGDDFAPLSVGLTRSMPSEAGPFYERFRCPIAFEARAPSITVDENTVDAGLPTANAELAHTSDRIVEDYLSQMEHSTVTLRLKTRLVDDLSSGEVSEESMSRALGMSARSLQRKLQEEQTSFKELLDETRSDLAVQYVTNSRLSISEISYLLGFSEPTNFTRAFKRWTGCAPSSYRSPG